MGGGASLDPFRRDAGNADLRILLAGDEARGGVPFEAPGVWVARCVKNSLRQVIHASRPDWVVLGEDWDDGKVRIAMLELLRTPWKAKVALLGLSADFSRCERWIRSGVSCYLASSSSAARVVDALQLSDRQNMVVVDACFQTRLVEHLALWKPQATLTEREIRLLKLAAAGFHTDEIARELHVTGHTVEFHFQRILAKMGARNRTNAVAQAMTLGLVTLAESLADLAPPV